MDSYPDGDTYDEMYGPNGIPFADRDPGAPDARGYSSGESAFATGTRCIEADGTQLSRISYPVGGQINNTPG